jgi:hypothetical protein
MAMRQRLTSVWLTIRLWIVQGVGDEKDLDADAVLDIVRNYTDNETTTPVYEMGKMLLAQNETHASALAAR